MSGSFEHPPRLEELHELLIALDQKEHDQLLEELFTAAPHEGEAMLHILDASLLDRAAGGFIEELPE